MGDPSMAYCDMMRGLLHRINEEFYNGHKKEYINIESGYKEKVETTLEKYIENEMESHKESQNYMCFMAGASALEVIIDVENSGGCDAVNAAVCSLSMFLSLIGIDDADEDDTEDKSNADSG